MRAGAKTPGMRALRQGIGAITKKILGKTGIFRPGVSLFCIFRNKELQNGMGESNPNRMNRIQVPLSKPADGQGCGQDQHMGCSGADRSGRNLSNRRRYAGAPGEGSGEGACTFGEEKKRKYVDFFV